MTSIDAETRYLPRNNLVMWEVGGEIIGKKVIYTIDLETGAVRRVVVNVVE